MRCEVRYLHLFVILCVGLATRGIVSLSYYSGAATPPMFGDYEAQRHWQEITYNLPAKEWYRNTTNNDLLYWGIDYPPLSAYHSFLMGIVARYKNSNYIKLFHSRGFESDEHKTFMRLTVLVADLIIYIPASTLCILSLKRVVSADNQLSTLMLLILYPGQLLIDNGHFQYNNVSLGLMLISVAALLHNRYNWTSFIFTLAINYKQMELYHAVPFFLFLLKASLVEKSFSKKFFKLLQIGFITLATFAIIWLPWITSADSLVITMRRLFPVNRGVFEDKVANVWCSLNIIYKFKKNLQNPHMVLICFLSTFLALMPTNIHLLFNFNEKSFLYSLVNTSLSFFLLSFQVHEKSILLAAIPVSCLFKIMPFNVLCFLKISVLSLFPLLTRDKLHIPYFCMIISYCIIFKYLIDLVYSKEDKNHQRLQFLMDVFDVTVFLISVAALCLPSPVRFPYLWPTLISVFCCMSFTLFLMIFTIFQCNQHVKPYKYFHHINHTRVS